MRELLVILVLLATACTDATVEPLRLGLVADPGGDLDRAVRLAVNQARAAGSRPVELAVVPPGPEAADRLAEIPVHAAILPPDPALITAALDLRLPVLVAGPADQAPHLVPGPSAEGRALARILEEDGVATVALVVSDDPRHRLVAERLAVEFSGEVLTRQALPPGIEPTLSLQAVAEAGAEAVACICARDALPGILREAFVMGLAGRPWYHTGEARERTVATDTFPEAPDRLAGQRGVALVVPDPTAGPAFPDFARSFEELAGSPPGAAATVAYDAAWLLILAAEADAPRDPVSRLSEVSRHGLPCGGPDCLRALAQGSDIDYQGASGPTDLGEGGSPTPVRVEVWRFTLDGGIESLEVRSYRS